MNSNKIITIGRQFGSGGRKIGYLLSQKLDFDFYDKELINMASKESGLQNDYFEKPENKSFFSYISNVFDTGFSSNYLSSENLFKLQSEIIKEAADTSSSVFVGRCADYILRDFPNAFNIFIYSDEKDRIQTIADRKSCSLEKAKEIMHLVDKRRKEYYNFYSNKNWGRATSYHLCINSSVLGIEKTTDLLIDFITRKTQNSI